MATLDKHGPGADYRLLFESLVDPVFVVGQGALVTFCNEAAAALCRPFGLQGPIGRRFAELLHPQDWQTFEEGEQVVVNLAANARDAMPKGGKLIIETHHAVFDHEYVRQHVGATTGRYVVLSVSDTGTGMTEEVKARIFEPFFTTKDVGKGTGLGLSTVYGIVKQHGGHVWVYSKSGRGTTFRVSFPVRSDGEKAEPKRPASEAVDLRGHETVLVVEDDPVVRRSVRRILKQYGYEVIEAADGREGLLTAQETVKPIDLLLTDVVLPGLDGQELSEKVKLLHPEAKVLFMSGYTDTVIAHHGILDPGVAFIAKPFSSEALGKKVREVLRTDAPVEGCPSGRPNPPGSG
jgi:CheY-like chemotaxis protein